MAVVYEFIVLYNTTFEEKSALHYTFLKFDGYTQYLFISEDNMDIRLFLDQLLISLVPIMYMIIISIHSTLSPEGIPSN